MTDNIWKTDKKCPKCGSRNFQIEDFCKVTYIYECVDGVVTPAGQGDSCDRISRVCCCRECGHEWHPRGDVFGED